jgi:AcrR family transcriptional regulator
MNGVTRATRATRTASGDVEQALVNAAESVLVRGGLGAVTVRAVAAEAGVAPMGVYSRFGGKDGLIQALVMRAFELLRAAVADRGEVDPLVRLRAAGVRYREFALAYPQHYALIFGGSPGTDAGENPEVEAKAAAAFEALVATVSYGIGAGVMTPGDPVDLAMQIWSAVHGAVALELADLVLTEDPAATYGRLLDLLVAGVTHPH